MSDQTFYLLMAPRADARQFRLEVRATATSSRDATLTFWLVDTGTGRILRETTVELAMIFDLVPLLCGVLAAPAPLLLEKSPERRCAWCGSTSPVHSMLTCPKRIEGGVNDPPKSP